MFQSCTLSKNVVNYYGGYMKKYENRSVIPKDLSCRLSDMAFARFKSFCNSVLGLNLDELPSEQSIFMKQSLSIVFFATILFLITNGFYLVKNIIFNTMIVIDMVPLYMMVVSSLLMMIFILLNKNYGSSLSRYALLSFYTAVIASVTVFMVSCNFHGIGLSISMCYLFVIMAAPTYRLSDTAFICILISLSWWLPAKLPYAENYDLFKHFLLRFSIIAGFIAIRSVFLRQSSNERYISEMNRSFIKLAYNDMMTGTLNKKAMETYCAFVAKKLMPEKVSVIIYDIDNFKSYNDHYSHIKGDEALRLVAESVVNVLCRSGRYLFRFGGEEFVIILPDTAEDEACLLAGELIDAVRAAALPRKDLPDKSIITASFGVACGTSEELGSLSIIAKADKQLYICKNSGKDAVAASGVVYKTHGKIKKS